MNSLLLSINWNPNPELFNLFGISIRYYGLLWAVGIFFAYIIVHYQYRDKKIDEKKFDPLFFYCFFGILIGARLGHCLFYDPGQYLTSGKAFANQVPARRRMEIHRLRRTCQPRRYTWIDDRSLAVLPQDEASLYGCSGHDCCRYACHCLLHPSGKLDELRNYR